MENKINRRIKYVIVLDTETAPHGQGRARG